MSNLKEFSTKVRPCRLSPDEDGLLVRVAGVLLLSVGPELGERLDVERVLDLTPLVLLPVTLKLGQPGSLAGRRGWAGADHGRSGRGVGRTVGTGKQNIVCKYEASSYSFTLFVEYLLWLICQAMCCQKLEQSS